MFVCAERNHLLIVEGKWGGGGGGGGGGGMCQHDAPFSQMNMHMNNFDVHVLARPHTYSILQAMYICIDTIV